MLSPEFNIRQKFSLWKRLGSGTFGTVYECRKISYTNEKDDNIPEIVAIKHIDILKPVNQNQILNHRDIANRRQNLNREIEILQDVSKIKGCDNFMKLYAIYGNPSIDQHIFLICEKCDFTLTDYVRMNPQGIKEEEAKEFLRQIATALAHLFTHSIMHRDLKPDNILIQFQNNESPQIKIADFGYAIKIDNGDDLAKSRVGTPLYMSPEKLDYNNCFHGYNFSSEFYSLGIIFYFMMEGKEPFISRTENQLIVESKNFQKELALRLELNKKWSKDAIKLFSSLVHSDPAQRITIDELLKNQYLNLIKSPPPQFPNGITISIHNNSQPKEFVTLAYLLKQNTVVQFPFYDKERISSFLSTSFRYNSPKQVQIVKLFEDKAHIAWIIAELAIYFLKKEKSSYIILLTALHSLEYIVNLLNNYHSLLDLKTQSEIQNFEKLERVIAIKNWIQDIKLNIIQVVKIVKFNQNDIGNEYITDLLFVHAKQLAHEAAFNESIRSNQAFIVPLYWRAALLFKYLSEFCTNEEDMKKFKFFSDQTFNRLKFIKNTNEI